MKYLHSNPTVEAAFSGHILPMLLQHQHGILVILRKNKKSVKNVFKTHFFLSPVTVQIRSPLLI
jgi:hypothetical protein